MCVHAYAENKIKKHLTYSILFDEKRPTNSIAQQNICFKSLVFYKTVSEGWVFVLFDSLLIWRRYKHSVPNKKNINKGYAVRLSFSNCIM